MPIHKHDSKCCNFLKTVNNVDWYHCPNCDGGTILGRKSDEPSDYWSMTVGIVKRWEAQQFEPTDFGKAAQQIIKELKL